MQCGVTKYLILSPAQKKKLSTEIEVISMSPFDNKLKNSDVSLSQYSSH